ncbi:MULTISPECIES: putative entry exclusion protein TrbK-alt [Alphaproteobacteria]|uniref:putative entry exclusion protein TrbK-alt n=3 Tax=Pseudomonadota TaxID=1224 RepID=UPI00286A8095|nr:putative entry exclusion protein TrbK-alt [Sphingopyxis sp. BE235]
MPPARRLPRPRDASASAASAKAIEMGRAARIAGAAVLGGIAMTLALVAATLPPTPRASVPQVSGADAHPAPDDGLRRCRTVTTADPDCETAWEAKRRRFFGERRNER